MNHLLPHASTATATLTTLHNADSNHPLPPRSQFPPDARSSQPASPAKAPRNNTPPRSRSAQRRSSAAAVKDSVVNLHRWSHSTSSSVASASFNGHMHEAAAHKSTQRRPSRTRSRSPILNKTPAALTPLPAIPSLPALLPSTIFNPSSLVSTPEPEPTVTLSSHSYRSPGKSSTSYFDRKEPGWADSALGTRKRAHSIVKESIVTTVQRPVSRDSFVHPESLPAAQRPTLRSQADKASARRPLDSPPIHEVDSSVRSGSGPSRGSRKGSTSESSHSVGYQGSSSSSKEVHIRRESGSGHRLEDGTPPRTRERRDKDKKTMLSRALAKANTAVLLDNAQNYEGAMQAYSDACTLLQQVMIRSMGEEDRRKLDSIRITYTDRIEELKKLEPGYRVASGKTLPVRPTSNESLEEGRSMLLDMDEEPVIATAVVTKIINDRSTTNPKPTEPEPPPAPSLSIPAISTGPRESVISSAIREVQNGFSDESSLGRTAITRNGPQLLPLKLPGPNSLMDKTIMPPPLSPHRMPSPLPDRNGESLESKQLLDPARLVQLGHQRDNSTESISWLDTIDESGNSSCASSVHSLSIRGLRRKPIRHPSGATEAEFDAALDAAVEAAYDEGYEPFEDDQVSVAELYTNRVRDLELAKEREQEVEREEAIATAKSHYQNSLRNQGLPHVRESAEFNFHDEAEEEERLLDEMTREYMLDGFDFDIQTKSSLPRQSDSSGSSNSTHNSSMFSHRQTGGSSLSTVAEVSLPIMQKAPEHAPPPIPPVTSAWPPASETQAIDATQSPQKPIKLSSVKDTTSVRDRRLSGQNLKTLKIETSIPPMPQAPHTDKLPPVVKETASERPPIPKTAAVSTFPSIQSIDTTFKIPALPSHASNLALPSPLPPIVSPSSETTFTISPATPAIHHGMSPSSPKTGKTSATGIRKNKSSLSLKQRTLSISSPDGSDGSLATPLSGSFSFMGRKPANTLASTANGLNGHVDGPPSGGLHLFESDIHSPFSPGYPSNSITDAPMPLEPCPEAYLLRPFWLMRCFYQTLAHPRGGYLSNKLFIPRGIWQAKGIKLKNLDEKISNCDLLTAALQRLAAVDTLDADAVLEEMQAFETIIDQVQTHLAKRLGNEVGAHSMATLFKDTTSAPSSTITSETSADKASSFASSHESHAPLLLSKSALGQSKSYLTSWRKLRPKNSAVGLSGMASAKAAEVTRDHLAMSTLPMTSMPSVRLAKRNLAGVVFEGANAGYMHSLARLFDSVQILDQIARQVEDPGLKHSSPTHVGLELSMRHAAEFFGFYICRFVLADVSHMLDKFIKRGSEWVLV